MDELSPEDKLAVSRARKIQRFLSQPFSVAEVFTGSPGKYVSLKDTIKGFKMIVDGECDALPEQAFYMPGKINPTQCEALTMVAVRVFGNDTAVAFGGTQGNFQLNVYKPVMLHGVLESIKLLGDAMTSFDERCAQGIEPDLARIRENVERSLMLVTALNPHIGYENAAKIALAAHRGNLSLRDAALQLQLVSADDFDRWVDAAAMTRPGSG